MIIKQTWQGLTPELVAVFKAEYGSPQLKKNAVSGECELIMEPTSEAKVQKALDDANATHRKGIILISVIAAAAGIIVGVLVGRLFSSLSKRSD